MGYTPHVLVVGGGVVGTAIARDFAIRGLEVTLVERGPLASGITGRDAGVLESGARIAPDDPATARRCLDERRTLAAIASHCVDETGGLLVEHTTDDADAFDQILTACKECAIPVTDIDGEDLHEEEPALADGIERALRVPDAVVDPFGLTIATARDATQYGATIRTHTKVTDIVVENGTVQRVRVEHDPTPVGWPEDTQTEESDHAADDVATDGGERKKQVPGTSSTSEDDESAESTPRVEELDVDYVINAAGAWTADVAGLAGCSLPLELTDEARLVVEDLPVEGVITRPGMDSKRQLVPGETGCILTGVPLSEPEASEEESEDKNEEESEDNDESEDETSQPTDVETNQITDFVPETAVDELLESFESIVPDAIEATPRRSLRARNYTVRGHDRPRHSHDFVRIDHGKQHDCWGLMTVLGGSLTTHRFVAERVTDAVCSEFGIDRPCQTAEIPLPGSDDNQDHTPGEIRHSPSVVEQTARRLGSRTGDVLTTAGPNPVLCPCRSVTREEASDRVVETGGVDVEEVRIRTTATDGHCQGCRCADALVTERYPDYEPETLEDALVDLFERRWPGQRTASWDTQFEQLAGTYQRHVGWLNRRQPEGEIDISGFDDGVVRTTRDRTPGSRRNGGLYYDTEDLRESSQFSYGGFQ